jgi:hypothetical protein
MSNKRKYDTWPGITLEALYWIVLPWRSKQSTLVRAVDGERHFNDIGISHGFVHFAEPETGKCLGFCGVCYFVSNAKKKRK